MTEILRVVRLLRPYWRSVAQSLLVAALVLVLQIPGPYFTKILIDDAYPNGDLSLMSFALILGAGLSIGVGGISFMSGYFGQCVGTSMGLRFQTLFYQHVQSLDFSFFDSRETGEILARFGDMRSSITSVLQIVSTFIMNGLQLLIFPPILVLINWQLALISLAVLPFDTLLVLVSSRYLRRLSLQLAELSAELTARNVESLGGMRTIQALGLESRVYERLRALLVRTAAVRMRSALVAGTSSYAATLIRAGGALAYGWYGWTQVIGGGLSLGTFMAFSAYAGFLYGPIQNLIGLIHQTQMTLVHTGRFFEIYNLRPTIRDCPTTSAANALRGEIEFRGVSFSYDGRVTALQKIDLRIRARTTVALVGRSGSGKSTLAKLIPRFYDPSDGVVTIDGMDVRTMRLRSLRQQISFAMQGCTLFQGTILENLSFGRDVPRDEIEGAADKACIHEFVRDLPDGYNTIVGEGGVNLSEGQRQRIALARALLVHSPILILDEPTAALDVDSELHIQKALNTARGGRTTVIVAHRLSTIRQADEIVVLDGGRVAERGTHEMLMRRESVYAGLFNRGASM